MFAFVHRIIADALCGASAFMVRPKRRRQNLTSGGFDSLEPRLLMTVRIWDGSATLNDNWSDARNWVGEVAPVSGDDLIFPAGIGLLDRGTKNDLPFATFKSIEFQSGDYKLTGNSITLTGDITVAASQQPVKIEFPILLTAATHRINVGKASLLELNGRLSNIAGDAGRFIKTGEGSLIFGGTAINSLRQSMLVEQGRLILRKTNGVDAFSGPLTIGGGVNGPAGEARVIVDQLNPNNVSLPSGLVGSPAVTIQETQNGKGILESTRGNLRVGPLTLRGGTVQGTTLQLAGDVTVLPSSTRSNIDSVVLDLGSSQRRFKMASNSSLRITSAMQKLTSFTSGGQGLILESIDGEGGGTLTLFPSSANTYAGQTVVKAGLLEIDSAVAGRTVVPGPIVVSSSTNATARIETKQAGIVADGATVRIGRQGSWFHSGGIETIASLNVLDGGIVTAFFGSPDSLKVTGTTTVSANSSVEAKNTATIRFEGDVKLLGGSLLADGGNMNFQRDLLMTGGIARSVPAASGPANGILGFARGIDVQPAAAESRISGRIQFRASAFGGLVHRITVAQGPAVNDLTIDADIIPGSSTGELFKAGLGRLVFLGTSEADNRLNNAAGELLLEGEINNPAAEVRSSQGFVFGGGHADVLRISGGTFSPGFNLGTMDVNQAFFTNARIQFIMNGIQAGVQHDQLKAVDLHLGNAGNNLPLLDVQLRPGFIPALNQVLEIVDINNDSGVVGRFADLNSQLLDEGAIFVASGQNFQISYLGGDGNDIVIKRVNAAPAFQNRSLPRVIKEGDVATLKGVITEADPEDTFFLDVNWGDGTIETFTFPPGSPRQVAVSHRYLQSSTNGGNPGYFTVHAAWRDDHGASNAAKFQIRVKNSPPTISRAKFDSTPKLNEPAVLRAFVLDASPEDDIDVRVRWGDGSPEEIVRVPAGSTSFFSSHRYEKTGAFTVTLLPTDEDGLDGHVFRIRLRVL